MVARKNVSSRFLCRYVLENIDLLRSQLSELSTKLSSLSVRLDDEVRTRTTLQNSVQMYFMDIDRKKEEAAPAPNE